MQNLQIAPSAPTKEHKTMDKATPQERARRVDAIARMEMEEDRKYAKILGWKEPAPKKQAPQKQSSASKPAEHIQNTTYQPSAKRNPTSLKTNSVSPAKGNLQTASGPNTFEETGMMQIQKSATAVINGGDLSNKTYYDALDVLSMPKAGMDFVQGTYEALINRNALEEAKQYKDSILSHTEALGLNFAFVEPQPARAKTTTEPKTAPEAPTMPEADIYSTAEIKSILEATPSPTFEKYGLHDHQTEALNILMEEMGLNETKPQTPQHPASDFENLPTQHYRTEQINNEFNENPFAAEFIDIDETDWSGEEDIFDPLFTPTEPITNFTDYDLDDPSTWGDDTNPAATNNMLVDMIGAEYGNLIHDSNPLMDMVGMETIHKPTITDQTLYVDRKIRETLPKLEGKMIVNQNELAKLAELIGPDTNAAKNLRAAYATAPTAQSLAIAEPIYKSLGNLDFLQKLQDSQTYINSKTDAEWREIFGPYGENLAKFANNLEGVGEITAIKEHVPRPENKKKIDNMINQNVAESLEVAENLATFPHPEYPELISKWTEQQAYAAKPELERYKDFAVKAAQFVATAAVLSRRGGRLARIETGIGISSDVYDITQEIQKHVHNYAAEVGKSLANAKTFEQRKSIIEASPEYTRQAAREAAISVLTKFAIPKNSSSMAKFLAKRSGLDEKLGEGAFEALSNYGEKRIETIIE